MRRPLAALVNTATGPRRRRHHVWAVNLRRARQPSLNVIGRIHVHDAEPDTQLLWLLRERLGLTFTKHGVGIARCVACTVHIDGVASRSCVRPVSSVAPTDKVVTIEGLSPDRQHPLQKAWVKLDVPQCGY